MIFVPKSCQIHSDQRWLFNGGSLRFAPPLSVMLRWWRLVHYCSSSWQSSWRHINTYQRPSGELNTQTLSSILTETSSGRNDIWVLLSGKSQLTSCPACSPTISVLTHLDWECNCLSRLLTDEHAWCHWEMFAHTFLSYLNWEWNIETFCFGLCFEPLCRR